MIFKGARAYLSTIIDLYDRHVVSYKISKHNDNKLVIDTLNEAIAKEKCGIIKKDKNKDVSIC